MPPRALSEESKDNTIWWYVGGGVAAVLIVAVLVWFFARPGGAGPASPTSPATAPPEPTAAAATAEPTATEETVEPTPAESESEPSEEETTSMPEAPSERNEMYSEPPEMQIDPAKSYEATIVTAKGAIVAELDAGEAPQTVNNFVFLAREGFYDGLTFHRVEPGFVIQGGDPLGTGTGGPGYTVPAEIGLEHVEGALAMARRGDQVNPERASSGSQFYITLAPTPHLDGAYTVFGEVVEGMDVVQSIEIGDVIESVEIEEG
jgi:cyclophilin family peptidyl-prolyl cis-trans isomerase